MSTKKRKKKRLPNKILPIPCSDKVGWTEAWHPGRNLLNIPHSWRGIFCGPPSSGKSTTIKNIILRANPPFDDVTVVHYSADSTSEWDDIGATIISEVPDPHDIDPEGKKLLIFEDLDLSGLTKVDFGRLNRLFGYSSSHCNLSLALTCQNAFDCPPCVRRVANLFILYKQPDMVAMSQLATRTGLRAKDLHTIFENHITHDHGSLWVDLTRNSPAKLRVDGFTILQKASTPDDKKTLEDKAAFHKAGTVPLAEPAVS
jgi:hypothetical protein